MDLEAWEGWGKRVIFVPRLHSQGPGSGGREKFRSSHQGACSREGLGQATSPHTDSCLGTERSVLILSERGRKAGIRGEREREEPQRQRWA